MFLSLAAEETLAMQDLHFSRCKPLISLKQLYQTHAVVQDYSPLPKGENQGLQI